MKFEKINENKIRIFLNKKDLIEKNINFHSFMSNSIESQDLFVYALEKAEKEVGFYTKDCKVRIEALAVNTGDFVITVTKIPLDISNKNSLLLPITSSPKTFKHKFNVSRKNFKTNYSQAIYSFQNFDDFCDFCNLYSKLYFNKKQNIAKNISLFFYNNSYYLTFTDINSNYTYLQKTLNLLLEFSTPIHNSNLLFFKLQEYAEVIFSNNALINCSKYFTT